MISRRKFLTLGSVGAVGAAAAACARDQASESAADGRTENLDERIVAFEGPQQAGIITPMQNSLHFAAFDVSPKTDSKDLQGLLERWTACLLYTSPSPRDS